MSEFEEVLGFDQEGFDAVMDTVQRVRGLPPRRDLARPGRRVVRDTPTQWVKTTSGSTSTVTLSGGTMQAYPAVWVSTDSVSGAWTDQDAVWLASANGEALASGTRYLARCWGADASGKGVWMTEAQAPGGGFTGTQQVVSDPSTCATVTLHFTAGLLTSITTP